MKFRVTSVADQDSEALLNGATVAMGTSVMAWTNL